MISTGIVSIVGNKIKIDEDKKGKSLGIKKCTICQKNKECYSYIKDTFTNLDQIRNNYYTCQECMVLFSGDMLKTAFYIDKDTIIKLKQADIQDYVFYKTLVFPCLISFSESRKKHRLYRTKPTLSYDNINVSTDISSISINRGKDISFFEYLSYLYNTFEIPKAMLENGNISVHYINIMGIDEYNTFKQKTKTHIDTEKYKFLIKILNKKDEPKI
jgi:hypothetical protein